MTKYLRYEKALGSKVYCEIVEAITAHLAVRPVFAKQDILDETGFAEVSESVRWDYVRRMVEERHATELIPLAGAYFKRHQQAEESSFPARFMASGNGKRTVGYAAATRENGHFILQCIRMKNNITAGLVASTEKTIDVAGRVGVIGLEGPSQTAPQLPSL